MKAILISTDQEDIDSFVSVLDKETIVSFGAFNEFKAKYGEDIANTLLLKGDLDF